MLKGKMTIELTDVNTGETDVIEEENMVTNALAEIFSPLKSKRSNTVQICSIVVYKTTFGIVLDTSGYGAGQGDSDCPLTYAAIQKWIEDNYGVKISKSSITMVKDKCSVLKIDFKAGKEPDSVL